MEIGTDFENFEQRNLDNGGQQFSLNSSKTFDAGDTRQRQAKAGKRDKRGTGLGGGGNVHAVMIPEEWGSENSIGDSSGPMRDDPELVDKFRQIEEGLAAP